MTVSSQVSSVSYLGDGVTTLLPVPYYFLEQTHLLVTRVGPDSTTNTLVLGSDYSVSGAGNQAGGSVTMFTAPAAGYQIIIDRSVPATQETDYVPNDPFPAESHERALDKLTMLAQQVALGLGRALVRPVGKNYFDAQSYPIRNLGDGSLDFDAVNLRSMRAYVESMVAGVVGGTGFFLQSGEGAVPRTFQDKMREIVSVKDYGAIGWPNNDSPGIQRALNYAAAQPHPCTIHFEGIEYGIGETLIWKGNCWLKGEREATVLKLLPNANCTVLESQDVDYWESWTVGMSNLGYPMNGGIHDILIDGNAEQQGAVSTSLANLVYGMRIHSHRFGIGWLQIRRVKGVGMLTDYNAALMFSFRTDGIDDYGLQGSPLGSPSPYDFRQINIIGCLYEHFVFQGPADIPIIHLTTNYCGWLDNATIPTTPRTSLLFPGEEIHSVRIQTACQLCYLNANGALYGRSLYVAGFVRFLGGDLVCTGSWGGALIEGSAFGAIKSMSAQQNSWAWGGDYKPHLEITLGSGSASRKSRMTFLHTSVRRVTTPATPTSIGPGIYDDCGAQFASIDWVDSTAQAGHGLVLGPNNRGGIYLAVNMDSIQGVAGDGTQSAAILLLSGARDWRIESLRLTNCNRGVANLAANMRGIIRDGTIELNQGAVTGQIALDGIVASSQLASVVPGTGNIALDNINSWGLEILDGSTRYYNRFRATVTFDGSIAGAQVGATINHTMWRTPAIRDFTTAARFGGTTWPNISAGIRTITAGTIIPAAFVHAPQPGSWTMSISVG